MIEDDDGEVGGGEKNGPLTEDTHEGDALGVADAEEAYLARMAKGQGVCLAELTDLATRSDVSVTRVPFFDTEVRSVYGLRAMSAALFD